MNAANELREAGQNVSIYKRRKNINKQLSDIFNNGIKNYITINREGNISIKNKILINNMD